MKSITKTQWAFALIAMLSLAYFLSGCGPRIAVPNQPGSSGIHGGPAGALAGLAVYAAWISGAGLLCCGVAAVFAPNKLGVAKVAIGCVAILAISFLLGWIADHPTLVVGGCIAVLLCWAISHVWIHRVDVKKKTGLDLNWLCRVKAPKTP